MKQDIQTLLREKGASLADVATAAQVSKTTVHRVVTGQAKSRRVAKIIAQYLAKDINDLWPGAYPAQYRRRSSERVSLELAAAVRAVDLEAATA